VSENLVSKFAFTLNLYRYRGGAVHPEPGARPAGHPRAAPGEDLPPAVGRDVTPSAWSLSEYVFGVRTSKLTRHLGVKSLSTYSKEYVKQTRHWGVSDRLHDTPY
jgi:hypothetical protein